MRITRSTARKLNTAINDIVHVSAEGDNGIYRLTTRSLTGKGILIKWIYPEDLALYPGNKKGAMVAKKMDRGMVVPSVEGVVQEREEDQLSECSEELGSGLYSDATELVDEVAQAEELRRMREWESRRTTSISRFPFDRIMKKIGEEPTLILDDV